MTAATAPARRKKKVLDHKGSKARRVARYQAIHEYWQVQRGQVWELPSREHRGLVHRVMCGSAILERHIATLMQGQRVQLLTTDPPYCSGGYQEVNKAAGSWGEIDADNLSTAGYRALIKEMLWAANPEACYVFTDWRMSDELRGLVEASGLAVRSKLIWDKGRPALGGLWRSQYEEIIVGSRKTCPRQDGKAGLGNYLRARHVAPLGFHRTVGSVLAAKRTSNFWHFTEKPVELMRQLLAGDEVSARGRCDVTDLFGGSGGTVVAGDQLGRRVLSMDASPVFVSVELERAVAELGIKPRLVHQP